MDIKKILKTFGSWINLIGEEVNFSVSEGLSKPPSLCATCLSILGILVISVISYEFIRQSIDRTNPGINIELKTLSNYPKVNLEQNNFYFTLLPISELYSPGQFMEGSLYTITAEISIKTADYTKKSAREILKFQRKQLKVVRCSEVKEEFSYLRRNKQFPENLINNAFCFLPPEDLKKEYFVEGQALDSFESQIEIKIWPCSLDDPTECQPKRIVDGRRFLLIYPTPDIDYSKVDNFLDWASLGDTDSLLSTSNRQIHSYKFKHFEVFDQKDVFSSPKPKKQFFSVENSHTVNLDRNVNQLHCPKTRIGINRACPPYLEMRFASSNRVEIVTRTYPTLITALAEIGGFVELVLLFLGILYGLFNIYFKELQTHLVSKVFGLNKNLTGLKKFSEVIDQNLGIVEVMKELNGLKLINRAIFKDFHLKLMPEVLTKIKKEENLDEECKKKKEEAKLQTTKQTNNNNMILNIKGNI